jgi:hypothetical protein
LALLGIAALARSFKKLGKKYGRLTEVRRPCLVLVK